MAQLSVYTRWDKVFAQGNLPTLLTGTFYCFFYQTHTNYFSTQGMVLLYFHIWGVPSRTSYILCAANRIHKVSFFGQFFVWAASISEKSPLHYASVRSVPGYQDLLHVPDMWLFLLKIVGSYVMLWDVGVVFVFFLLPFMTFISLWLLHMTLYAGFWKHTLYADFWNIITVGFKNIDFSFSL